MILTAIEVYLIIGIIIAAWARACGAPMQIRWWIFLIFGWLVFLMLAGLVQIKEAFESLWDWTGTTWL